jgi:NADPH:quinone reductase-like Zn-dependent oxidoreductase
VEAFIYERYGSPDELELREVERPAVPEDGVLVRVRAASVNPVDWHTLTGEPFLVRAQSGLRKPRTGRLGVDFAGTVEAVGPDVTELQPGDEVFGGRTGAFADYVAVRDVVVLKPPNLSFEEAAAVPVAAVTALQGLRDKGRVQAGQKVLVNGASGGVGTFAVQLAKAFGAEVTGVCSTSKVELAQALGADRVFDYTREDFTRSGERYDLMIDIAGSRSWRDCTRVLRDDARVVVVGGPKGGGSLGSLGGMAAQRLRSLLGSRTIVTPFLAKLNRADLAELRDLLEAGKVKPVIDRRYALSEVPEALRYLAEGHASGKVVVTA